MHTQEEILYCDYCGGANTPSAVNCEHCQHIIGNKHSAFLTFLKVNTKERLLDKAKDKLFDKIQNFLLSHLYGVVVSVLVVTTAAAYTIPKDTHIQKVSNTAVVTEPTPNPEPQETELTEKDIEEIYNKLNEYAVLCDHEIIGENAPAPNMSFADVLTNADFPYDGVHNLRETGVYAYAFNNQFGDRGPSSATTSTMLLTNEELTSDLAKTLYENGYKVCENIFTGIGYYDGRVLDFSDFDSLSPDFRFDFQMVYVKIDGEWFIAEDRLL